MKFTETNDYIHAHAVLTYKYKDYFYFMEFSNPKYLGINGPYADRFELTACIKRKWSGPMLKNTELFEYVIPNVGDSNKQIIKKCSKSLVPSQEIFMNINSFDSDKLFLVRLSSIPNNNINFQKCLNDMKISNCFIASFDSTKVKQLIAEKFKNIKRIFVIGKEKELIDLSKDLQATFVSTDEEINSDINIRFVLGNGKLQIKQTNKNTVEISFTNDDNVVKSLYKYSNVIKLMIQVILKK